MNPAGGGIFFLPAAKGVATNGHEKTRKIQEYKPRITQINTDLLFHISRLSHFNGKLTGTCIRIRNQSVLISDIRGYKTAARQVSRLFIRVLLCVLVANLFATGKKNPATGGIHYFEASITLFAFA